jgi:hypothetical protein
MIIWKVISERNSTIKHISYFYIRYITWWLLLFLMNIIIVTATAIVTTATIPAIYYR